MENNKGEYLKELKLTNFRQFEELTLPIHPQLTVILSENGGGKTSICDAINLFLNGNEEPISYPDVKIGAENSKIELKLIGGAYYSVERNKRIANSDKADEQFFLYISLYNNKQLFDKFTNWFINTNNYENQQIARVDRNYRQPELQTLNNLWLKFFSGLDTAKYEAMDIQTTFEEVFDNQKIAKSYQYLIIKKDGIWFEISLLSAGEKQLMELFLMISLKVIERQKFVQKQIIVVIDEIDLHLHPRWQRNLLPALMETFPEVQFIVTTHSPLIVSNVKAEHIVVLKDYKAYPLKTQTAGRDVNSVLLEVFDIPERPKWAAELIDECDKLIAAEQWAEAQKHIDLLSQRFGSTDAEVMRLQLAYDFNAPHNALKG